MIRKYKIEDCQEIAKNRGGKCLSKIYQNCDKHLIWQCSKNHIWKATFYSVKNKGTWCRICANNNRKGKIFKSITLKDCQELAQQKGGKCLSIKYQSDRKKLLWQCSKKHIWQSAYNNVKHNKSWCAKCSGNLNNSLELCKQIAKERGGKCLSKKYENDNKKLLWQCSEKHIWSAKLNHIKISGSWCNICSKNKSENLVRKMFENMFQQDFPSIKPTFLNRLELDGYCENLGLAFEYNGKQHYEYIPHFHRNGIGDLHKQQERDKLKHDLCKENNITLITIPYTYDYTNEKELQNYIYDEVMKHDYLYQELINNETIIVLKN